ncbi:MAG: hypothetical protein JW982_11840 [Spirochaetes bacterium]|nr:hypothetical protein [Spirochaetota bacterium]
MSYWNEVKDLLKKGTDIAVENIRQGAETAADKTKEATIAAKGKAKIFLKHRELLEVFADMGELLYNNTKNSSPENNVQFFTNPDYLALVKKADEITAECTVIAKESGIDEKEFSHRK